MYKEKCGDVETITKFFDGLQRLDLSKNELERVTVMRSLR